MTALLSALATPLSAQGPRDWAGIGTGEASASAIAVSAIGDDLPATGALARPSRLRNGLVGGAIGAAAGVIVCTVISSIADDSADPGLSTCTLKGYLLTGGIGFALGFGVGLAL